MKFHLPKYHIPDFTGLNAIPDARFSPAPADGVAPNHYYATSIYPTYIKCEGLWLLARHSRMDCVAVREDGGVHIREFRHIKQGDMICTGRSDDGSEGILIHPHGFIQDEPPAGADIFAFRQGRSRETAFSIDYDTLYQLLAHEREHGYIVWVLGPVLAFDADARQAMAQLIRRGYAHALLAGNALATHDLEAAYLHSALGQDIYTQHSYPNGHYHHIDTINRVRGCGSIAAFLDQESITDGIMAACEQTGVPYVLAGSIRDDGPLPGVLGDAYAAQDSMRRHTAQATTVICLAPALHTIAAGNMTPAYRIQPDGQVRPVYFYSVDVSEFIVNKLHDRGSLSARGIVTNAQDFIVQVNRALA